MGACSACKFSNSVHTGSHVTVWNQINWSFSHLCEDVLHEVRLRFNLYCLPTKGVELSVMIAWNFWTGFLLFCVNLLPPLFLWDGAERGPKNLGAGARPPNWNYVRANNSSAVAARWPNCPGMKSIRVLNPCAHFSQGPLILGWGWKTEKLWSLSTDKRQQTRQWLSFSVSQTVS